MGNVIKLSKKSKAKDGTALYFSNCK